MLAKVLARKRLQNALNEGFWKSHALPRPSDRLAAKTYLEIQRILAYSTRTCLTADADPTQLGEWVTFTASIVSNSSEATGVPSGAVQFAVDGLNAEPVKMNGKGGATWARYAPDHGRLRARGRQPLSAQHEPSKASHRQTLPL